MKKFILNKKTIPLILAGVMGLNSGLALKKAKTDSGVIYLVTTSELNLRYDKNTSSKILAVIDKGDIVEALSPMDDGWYNVNYDYIIGYVCGDYVKEIAREYPDSQIVRALDSVRVRRSPSTEAEVLTVLEKGDVLDYLGVEDGWYKVKYQNDVAYVSCDYSEVDKDGLLIERKPVVIATEDVRIRSEATTESNIMSILKEDDYLQYNRRLKNGWYEVLYEGKTAYVCGDYVKESQKDVVKNEIYKIVALNDDATIYKDKDLKEAIGTIPKYELGKVYSRGENYYLIASDAGVGYIRRDVAKNLGNVAVVVDISTQNLVLYKDAKPYYISNVVTGQTSTPTDIGLFEINAKVREYDLTKYDVHVSYWMPFNGDQGLHDASWRNNFGGNIYKNNGSHGCINLPFETAAEVFENVEKGTKVLVKK